MWYLLASLAGGAVGFMLGLTGGGGSLVAVPLLVYGLGLVPQDAVAFSLLAVGTTAAVGMLGRSRAGEVCWKSGLTFALAGMWGAPGGVWLAHLLSAKVLLVVYAGLMVAVAARIGLRAAHEVTGADPSLLAGGANTLASQPWPVARLALLGLGTGVLSGLFGVGGGVIIVPALVLVAGLPIRQAIGTSLLVIALVSLSGVTAHLIAGDSLHWRLLAWFTLGGVLGMQGGTQLGRYLSGPTLQKTFAVLILTVAGFMLLREL